MRVLHVGNIAGIGMIFSKYLNKKCIESHNVFYNKEIYDPMRYYQVYPDYVTVFESEEMEFLKNIVCIAENYDIIHIHTHVPWCATLKTNFPEKPIVFEYHGTDLRDNIGNQYRLEMEKYADKIICSTQDLPYFHEDGPGTMLWVPNPVDTDHFQRIDTKKAYHKYLTICRNERELKKITDMLYKAGMAYHFDYIDRSQFLFTYAEMPRLFSMYEYYFDIKFGGFEKLFDDPLQILSKSAMEAICCGLVVYTNDFDNSDKLRKMTQIPEYNKPENATDYLVSNVYTPLMRC